MMSFFMNPWTMMAGAILVSTPIIIHLINRMRFRKVKWAAMEFLLKAQKKMRRKKILEQLLLLLLRCLLVFLAGVLFARFLGFDPLVGKETRPVAHIIILDDTPSMADTGEAGAPGDAFTVARAQITEKILPAAAKATTPQSVRIIRLSDQVDLVNTGSDSADPQRIDLKFIDSVRATLAAEKVASIHVPLSKGLEKAKQYFDAMPGSEVAKVIHVVSDMRQLDWSVDAAAISERMKESTDAGVKVHLIDVASPNRTRERKSPAFSDNVGIVELKPRNRVAAKDKEVEFEIRVRNYGNTDLKNVLVEFFLNGQGNTITTIGFETLPANQEQSRAFIVSMNQTATKEDPLARFNVVSAVLKNTGADAIASDNIRHSVVEVREKLSVLVVMNREEFEQTNKSEGPKKEGDSYYLRNLFEIKFNGIDWVSATPDVLTKRDLREFSSIYLLNVPSLTEAEAAQLDRYVSAGGGAGFFLGEKVLPEAYNKVLYQGGTGLFPVPLSTISKEMTQEEKDRRAFLSLAKRVLLRDPAAKSHDALRGIYEDKLAGIKDTAEKVERSFLFAGIYRHWVVERIGRWRSDSAIKELYCLPNEASIETFQGRAKALADAIRAKYGEPKFEKHRVVVDGLLNKIAALTADSENPPLTELARQMDRLLSDQVSENDANEALLREFWSQDEMSEPRALAQSLRDSSKYGDPLYIARKRENGRVAVFTIPAGGAWLDWPYGPGSSGWVAVMTEVQGYLAGGGAELNRAVGSEFTQQFEKARYKAAAVPTFISYDVLKPNKTTQKAEMIREPKQGKDAKEFPLDLKGEQLELKYPATNQPGVYVFTMTWQNPSQGSGSGPATKPEYIAAVFNPDTEREGDLRRVNYDEFDKIAKGALVHTPDEDYERQLEQRPSDLSSGRWLYLLIVLVLVFEQAMAVRLSYHGKADDLAAFAPSAAAAMAGRTAVPTESETSGAGPAA